VREVEGENRKAHPLRNGHHRSVGEAEIDFGEAGVELDSAAQRPRGEEDDGVLPGDERVEEEPRATRTDTRAKELIDLDHHRFRDNQLAPELADKRSGEPMRTVAAVRRGDERPGIGDDSQRAATCLRR
jgi:hypothetical protein